MSRDERSRTDSEIEYEASEESITKSWEEVIKKEQEESAFERTVGDYVCF